METKYRVMRNLNRTTGHRWMYRKQGEPLVTAVETSGPLICTGVQFVPSDSEEGGAGCYVVAVCDSVEVLTEARQKELPPLINVALSSTVFEDSTGKAYDEAQLIVISPNGPVQLLPEKESVTESGKALAQETCPNCGCKLPARK